MVMLGEGVKDESNQVTEHTPKKDIWESEFRVSQDLGCHSVWYVTGLRTLVRFSALHGTWRITGYGPSGL